MRLSVRPPFGATRVRPPAVAGSFYPDDPGALGSLVDQQVALARDRRRAPQGGMAAVVGLLVPHAGLEYSGVVAAVGWSLLADSLSTTQATDQPIVVLLGTVHRAWWLDGIGVWEDGAWRTPLGDVETDADLAAAIAGLGSPFTIDREAHRDEHSIEVQLPFVRRLLPRARIVPLAVAAGTGALAADAGRRLGALLSAERAAGRPVVVAVSSDMAHYPPADIAERITETLAARILELDPAGLAVAEAGVSGSDMPGIACGMCGIAPTVVGLAALRSMGVRGGVALAAATSADVGAPPDRTVGYLAVAFQA